LGTRGSARLEVNDPDRTWTLRDGRFVEPRPSANPDAAASLHAAGLARLWTDAPGADLATTTGDPSLLEALRRARAIVV
jgi:hypothetical protein